MQIYGLYVSVDLIADLVLGGFEGAKKGLENSL